MAGQQQYEFVVTPEYSDVRLDKYLHSFIPAYSRTYLQQLINQNLVIIDSKKVKASHRVTTGERVLVFIPKPVLINLKPMNIPIDIIFEDQYLLVINKPAGLVVHPGAGICEGTLVNALLYYCKDLSAIGGKLRPGIVHKRSRS
jgi:23S rRNA pseudouridine1911/1915/1917 synthase